MGRINHRSQTFLLLSAALAIASFGCSAETSSANDNNGGKSGSAGDNGGAGGGGSPETCDAIKAAEKARLDILFGCETIIALE